jgi:chaperonin GroEL (HSP60 family)
MSKMMSMGNIGSMLKEGTTHLQGLDDATAKNIEAVKGISEMTRTSLGPNGMHKIVVNHLGRLFVTSDAATIMKELDVEHPAAKLVVMGSQTQQEECGDGTNLGACGLVVGVACSLAHGGDFFFFRVWLVGWLVVYIYQGG